MKSKNLIVEKEHLKVLSENKEKNEFFTRNSNSKKQFKSKTVEIESPKDNQNSSQIFEKVTISKNLKFESMLNEFMRESDREYLDYHKRLYKKKNKYK